MTLFAASIPTSQLPVCCPVKSIERYWIACFAERDVLSRTMLNEEIHMEHRCANATPTGTNVFSVHESLTSIPMIMRYACFRYVWIVYEENVAFSELDHECYHVKQCKSTNHNFVALLLDDCSGLTLGDAVGVLKSGHSIPLRNLDKLSQRPGIVCGKTISVGLSVSDAISTSVQRLSQKTPRLYQMADLIVIKGHCM
ncbi:hypothetical protein AG1IA_08229 [Rhizoctonia solani AG-1 IA]|uniref:Uncharacterized protein n=1 Tax=Thanatephorus cucumeris (strain AG1-IA) TaxID=983506 RepID=L8WN14_THACA|nr:hypothetical protein AG1IA_08229 [Rhizoctonia solani AG-1 IA]